MKIKVEIIDIIDPGEFYLRFLPEQGRNDSAAKFVMLQHQMEKYYSNTEDDNSPEIETVLRGNHFALLVDNTWRRIIIINRISRQPYFTCKDVDYGSIHKVHFSKLRVLCNEFKELNSQIRRCILNNIDPISMCSSENGTIVFKKVNIWSTDAINKFRSFITNASECFVDIINNLPDGSHEVRLFFNCNGNLLCANDELVNVDTAIQSQKKQQNQFENIDNLPIKPESVDLENSSYKSTRQNEKMYECKNSKPVNIKKPNEISVALPPVEIQKQQITNLTTINDTRTTNESSTDDKRCMKLETILNNLTSEIPYGLSLPLLEDAQNTSDGDNLLTEQYISNDFINCSTFDLSSVSNESEEETFNNNYDLYSNFLSINFGNNKVTASLNDTKLRFEYFNLGAFTLSSNLKTPATLAHFPKDLLLSMDTISKNKFIFNPIHKIAWPILLNGDSLFLITDSYTYSRTEDQYIEMSFVIPIVIKLNNLSQNNMLVDYAASFLILTDSWKSTNRIVTQLKKLTKFKIVSALDSKNLQKFEIELLGGCHVIVCSANIFFNGFNKNSDRIFIKHIRFLCLYNSSKIVKHYDNDLNYFMYKWKFFLHEKKLVPQICLLSEYWTNDVAKFHNTYLKNLSSYFFNCNPVETALMSKINLKIICSEETRMMYHLSDKIKKHNGKKIIIQVKDEISAKKFSSFLYDHFKKTAIICNGAKNFLDWEKLWTDNITEKPIFIKIADNSKINLYTAEVVLIYELRKKVPFVQSFTWLYHRMFHDTVSGGQGTTLKPVIEIFLTESSLLNIWRFNYFIDRFSIRVPKVLDDWTKKSKRNFNIKKEENKVELCHELLAYGVCHNEMKCKWRHCFSLMDRPGGDCTFLKLPEKGKVVLQILSCITAASYYARLVSYNGKNYNSDFVSIKCDVSNYYDIKDNRRYLKKCCLNESCLTECVKPGELAAVKLEDGRYVRVKVVEVESLDEPWKKDRIVVFLMDNGTFKIVKPIDLMVLPKELAIIPGQVFKVRISRIKPIDDDVDWTESSKTFVESLLLNKSSDTKITANIILATSDTLVVDQLAKKEYFKVVNNYTSDESIRIQLINTKIGLSFPSHLPKLLKLTDYFLQPENSFIGFTAHGEIVKLNNSKVNKNDIVTIVSAKNPLDFYISKVDEDYEEFIEELESYSQQELPYGIDWSVDTYVLAKKYKKWNRAKVLSVVNHNQFLLLLIDTGESTFVHGSNIRCLKKKLLEKPFKAILCKLNGIHIDNDLEKNYKNAKIFLNLVDKIKFEIVDVDDKGSHYNISLADVDRLLVDFDLTCLLESLSLGKFTSSMFDKWFRNTRNELMHDKCFTAIKEVCGQTIIDELYRKTELNLTKAEYLLNCQNENCWECMIEFLLKTAILIPSEDDRLMFSNSLLNLFTNDNERFFRYFLEVEGFKYVGHLLIYSKDIGKIVLETLSERKLYKWDIFTSKYLLKSFDIVFELNNDPDSGFDGMRKFCCFVEKLLTNMEFDEKSLGKCNDNGIIVRLIALLKNWIDKDIRVKVMRILNYQILNRPFKYCPFDRQTIFLVGCLFNESKGIANYDLQLEYCTFINKCKWDGKCSGSKLADEKHIFVANIHESLKNCRNDDDKNCFNQLLSILTPKKSAPKQTIAIIQPLKRSVVDTNRPTNNDKIKLLEWSESLYWLKLKVNVMDYESGNIKYELDADRKKLTIEVVCKTTIYSREYNLKGECESIEITNKKPKYIIFSLKKKIGEKWGKLVIERGVSWVKGDINCDVIEDEYKWDYEDENPLLKPIDFKVDFKMHKDTKKEEDTGNDWDNVGLKLGINDIDDFSESDDDDQDNDDEDEDLELPNFPEKLR